MKTTRFSKILAAIMLVMVLVSAFATSAFAANATGEYTLNKTQTGDFVCTDTGTGDAASGTAAKVCTQLGKLGYSAGIVFRVDATSDLCKYATSVEIDGLQTTVYLSQKPETSDIGVTMGEGNKLEINGITSDDTSAWNQLFDRFKGIIVGLTGVGTLVMIVLFIVQFMKLGSSAGNPQARSQALTGVLWTGVAAALLGSVTIIVGFFYNAI